MPADTAPPALRAAPSRGLRSRRGLQIAGLVGGVLAVVVVVTGVLGRRHQVAATRAWTSSQAIPAVAVVQASAPTGPRTLTLPGQLQAWYNAPIYSRVSGYVRIWTHDIGARVRRGELLAEIDTPETDQQIIQARADVATAEANLGLARTTAQR